MRDAQCSTAGLICNYFFEGCSIAGLECGHLLKPFLCLYYNANHDQKTGPTMPTFSS